MNHCLNCDNYEPRKDGLGLMRWGCKTMFSPMDGYSCHMTNESIKKAETDVEEYVFNTNRRY